MILRFAAALAFGVITAGVCAWLKWGAARRRYIDAVVLVLAWIVAFGRSDAITLAPLFTSVISAAAIVGVVWLWRTGGLERYFWGAAVSYFLYQDVAAKSAAVVAFRSIPIRAIRDNILAGLQGISITSSSLSFFWLLIIEADATGTSDCRTGPVEHAATVIQGRAADLQRAIVESGSDRQRLRAELGARSSVYERALFGLRPRPEVFFGRVRAESVRQIDTLLTS